MERRSAVRAALARQSGDAPKALTDGRKRPALPAPAPALKGPAKPPRRTSRQRLADALTSMHGEGDDIHSPASIEGLRTSAMGKAGIKVASKTTFERALRDARASVISVNSVKFPQ
jgi:hypothetical protein